MRKLLIIGAIIIAAAIVATFAAMRWASSGDAYRSAIAAECATFAATPIPDELEGLAYLDEQRKEYERRGNTEMVARIDTYLANWEATKAERHARAWALYEEACLPEPNRPRYPKLVL